MLETSHVRQFSIISMYHFMDVLGFPFTSLPIPHPFGFNQDTTYVNEKPTTNKERQETSQLLPLCSSRHCLSVSLYLTR